VHFYLSFQPRKQNISISSEDGGEEGSSMFILEKSSTVIMRFIPEPGLQDTNLDKNIKPPVYNIDLGAL
jgi:hypothetical protein